MGLIAPVQWVALAEKREDPSWATPHVRKYSCIIGQLDGGAGSQSSPGPLWRRSMVALALQHNPAQREHNGFIWYLRLLAWHSADGKYYLSVHKTKGTVGAPAFFRARPDSAASKSRPRLVAPNWKARSSPFNWNETTKSLNKTWQRIRQESDRSRERRHLQICKSANPPQKLASLRHSFFLFAHTRPFFWKAS